MNNGSIIAVVTVVLVVALLVVFMYSYFYFLRRDVLLMWSVIRIQLGERLDKLPLLVELARGKGVDVSGLGELVETRAQLWKEAKFGKSRVKLELMISNKIHELFGLLHKNEELKKDIYFLSQKKEIQEAGVEIDSLTEAFNHKIRGYNGKVGFLLLRPLTRIMGFKKMPVFEFEP